MSELALMNEDIVHAISNLSTQRILDLSKEVVECRVCPRLVEYRERIARVKKRRFLSWNYWGRPVPGFGDIAASIFVIGLAPAAHGGNRTGRVFTGDRSADFLVKALCDAGFANQPRSNDLNDGLVRKSGITKRLDKEVGAPIPRKHSSSPIPAMSCWS